MNKKKRGFLQMSARLFKIAKEVKGKLIISTLASVFGNMGHLGLMGFGAMMILSYAGLTPWGNSLTWRILMGISAFTIMICRFTEGLVSHDAAYTLLRDMRVHMFKVVKDLAPACLMDRQKGDILSVAVADIETIEFFFAHTIGPVFTVILLPLTTLIIAGKVNIIFVWVLLPLYLIISVILPYISLKAGINVGRQYRRDVGKLKSHVLESVYGMRDIQIFGIGDERRKEVIRQTEEINKSAHVITWHRQLVTSAPTFFIYLARILIIAVASYLAAKGESDPVGVIVLSFVVSASFSSTQSLTMVVSSLLETFAAAERLFDLEDTQPAVTEAEHPVELGKIEKIEFKNVSFAYNKGEKPVLENLNLVISGKDKIGVMGASGIGKSTIIRLLLRFWDVTSGEILINGINIKDISLYSLRSHIALLEQDTFIFNDTIAGNIAFGKPAATLEEIKVAAKRAGLAEFIETLPDKYDTDMGELGSRLSGGERQRVGIARVMLTNPDMLVMDEPTSALDIINEKGLLKTLDREYKDKMIMIVSHRRSTLTDCNRILTVKDGKLTEKTL